MERDGHRAGRQRHANDVQSQFTAARFRAGVSRSAVVQSSRVVSQAAPSGVGFIELAVHGSAEAVRDFYQARLAAAGFTVDDLGLQGLNAATAAYLGLAGTLVGKRASTDDVLTIQIRDEEGILLRSSLLQLSWRKLSEWPAGHPRP
jgi:hypothetical protein